MGGSGQVKVTTIYFDFDRHLPTVEDDSSSSDDFGRSVNHQPSTLRYVNINQSLYSCVTLHRLLRSVRVFSA